MRIGLDIMGGDFAPEAAVLGAIQAQKELTSEDTIVLFGDSEKAKEIINAHGHDPALFEFIHTTEIIEMGEHPTKAITQKPNSSIAVGFHLLGQGNIDSFASAGNTGAMLVGSMFSVKTVPGVTRPAIASNVPREDQSFGLILDVGANADCKPETLLQFAILGSIYAQEVFHIDQPKVGLLNLGEEAQKGNLLTQAAYPMLQTLSQINFIGNIEGRDLFSKRADVIVCDGFTGNVVLKMAESFYDITSKRGFSDTFIERFNYEQYGGSPILGLNAPVIIGHGISKPEAIKNMILLSQQMIQSDIVHQMKAALN